MQLDALCIGAFVQSPDPKVVTEAPSGLAAAAASGWVEGLGLRVCGLVSCLVLLFPGGFGVWGLEFTVYGMEYGV